MSEWKKVKLGEICKISAGGDRPSLVSEKETIHCQIPIYSNGIDNQGLYGFTDKAKIKGNAITITGRGANVGTVFYRETAYYPIIRLLSLVPNNDIINPRYLYYLIKDRTFLSTGSAQPQITVPNISNYEINYNTNLDIQHRIATILSRYDSLIENYQKQIKLLEESAQRLYKEWFIDLRFPGHENTKIVDGVPEGWEKKRLGEIADINKRNIPKNHNLPYIDYTDLGSVRVGNIDNPFRYNTGEEPGRAKRVAIDGDIIWGMVRPNLKSYALIQYPQKYDVFSTGFAVLSATKVPFSFLYCALTTDSFVGYLMNCTNGAAYPAVKPEHFAAAKLLIPSLDCIEAFDLKIKRCFRKIHIIQTQIRHLTEARDRLLPKLMSGEIEV